MLTSLLILLLLSNAFTLRKDKSILYSRVAILGLISTSFLALNNLFIKPLGTGIGIYGGLFNVTTFTQTFNIFIFIISPVILTITVFYPSKVYVKEHSTLLDLLSFKFCNKNFIYNNVIFFVFIITLVSLVANLCYPIYSIYLFLYNMVLRKIFIYIFLIIFKDIRMAKLCSFVLKLILITDLDSTIVFHVIPSDTSSVGNQEDISSPTSTATGNSTRAVSSVGYQGDVSRSVSVVAESGPKDFGVLVEGLSYREVIQIRDNVFEVAMTRSRDSSVITVGDVLARCSNPDSHKVLERAYASVNHPFSMESILTTKNINREAAHSVHFSPAMQVLLDMKQKDD